MSNGFPASLGRIYPPERVITEPAGLARFERDLVSPMTVRPVAVVTAVTQDEVIETVRLCHEAGVPFLARGAGSSLSGGALPPEGGIIIALNELNHILRLDPLSRIAVVEPGVINLEVSNAAARHNLYYAPDPSSQAFCTIGGNVAFNSGGAHCLKYGMTANHVLGIKAVLADGRVVRLGGETLETAGPDLTAFFVGSEGLFGIALEITLRLLPRVERYRTGLATYDTLEQAGHAVAAVVASGLLPGALEIMDPLAIKACEAASGAGYPLDAGALLIAELEGETVQVEAEFAALLELVRRSGAHEVREAQSDEERAAIWKGRKAAFTAVRQISKRYIVQDGVVPRNRLGEALAEIDRLSQRYAIPVANVFHAGDGNLHPLILYDAAESPSFDRASELAGEILRMCIRMGGSITGEHGVGLEKRDYLPEMFGQAEMENMVEMRRTMDPKGIANPGKMLPLKVSYTPDNTADPAGAGQPATSAGERLRPADVHGVQQAVRSAGRVAVVGAGTKPGLAATGDGATVLDLSALSGVLQYDPIEFTFTALSGTPIAVIADLLAEHAQYLPFDPPLAAAGATLGGTVASGLSGPGRYRYGGVRDFILEAVFVDGLGRVLRGGARVVKNAAGFDYPKLMVGSLGRLGVLVELTFKVFPRPPAAASVFATFGSIADAVHAAAALATASLDLDALEIEVEGRHPVVWVRVAGFAGQLSQRVDRITALLPGALSVENDIRAPFERRSAELAWSAPDGLLARVPVTTAGLGELESVVHDLSPVRRYSVGGNIAWLAAPPAAGGRSELVGELDRRLKTLGLSGVVIRGAAGSPMIGTPPDPVFLARVKHVMDPHNRFGGY